MRALSIFAGATARARLAERGWDADLFSLLLGASGGPKWLVLSQLDRVLFGRFLSARTRPLHAFGTSIGAWRHACLAQADPVAATGRMEAGYIEQRYDARPSAAEVTRVSKALLASILGAEGAEQIVRNDRVVSHIGTVRGRGLCGSRSRLGQGSGLTLAALTNLVGRKVMQTCYQRVLFSTGALSGSGLAFDDFATHLAPLTPDVLPRALIASGSIPLVLEGERDLPGGPPGQYWDGGLLDYHHDLSAAQGDGLVLYPHFFPHVIPGWFDKPLKGRFAAGQILDRVVLICPSPGFVASLPGAKVPDRKDFKQLENDARIERWWQVTRRCEALASQLTEVLEHPDPLAYVTPFPVA